MATDLHAALKAAVEKRMAVARAAGSTSRSSSRMVGRYGDWRTEPYYTSDDEPWSVVIQSPLGQIASEMPTRLAEHIAANDPATIVRHCLRDLAVLERHERIEQQNWHALPYPGHSTTDPACLHCQLTSNDGDPFYRDWPCAEITDLAAAYGIEAGDG